jgi:hypothetical protein
MLQNMSAFESPPNESCSSIVSFEFLRTVQPADAFLQGHDVQAICQ